METLFAQANGLRRLHATQGGRAQVTIDPERKLKISCAAWSSNWRACLTREDSWLHQLIRHL
jgi:hypothetical protein